MRTLQLFVSFALAAGCGGSPVSSELGEANEVDDNDLSGAHEVADQDSGTDAASRPMSEDVPLVTGRQAVLEREFGVATDSEQTGGLVGGMDIVLRTALADRDEVGPLGFSGGQAQDRFLGEYAAELYYVDGGETLVSISLTATGGVLEEADARGEFIVEQWGTHKENDHLAFEVEVEIETEDGRFLETFTTGLKVSSLERASLLWTPVGGELNGSYQAPEAVRNPSGPQPQAPRGDSASGGGALYAILRFELVKSAVAARGRIEHRDQNPETTEMDWLLVPYAAW